MLLTQDGSLYDALYGTDVIPGNKFKEFNEERASKVIAYVRKFLDEIAPQKNLVGVKFQKLKLKTKIFNF